MRLWQRLKNAKAANASADTVAQSFWSAPQYPSGPAQSPCPDFADVVNQPEESEGAYHNGELIRPTKQTLRTVQRWTILNTHPIFTGVCPKCGEAIAAKESASPR